MYDGLNQAGYLFLLDDFLFLRAEHVDADAVRVVALEGFLVHAQVAGILDQPLAVDLDVLVGVDGRALDLRAAVGIALGEDQVVLQVPLAVGNGIALEPDDRVGP